MDLKPQNSDKLVGLPKEVAADEIKATFHAFIPARTAETWDISHVIRFKCMDDTHTKKKGGKKIERLIKYSDCKVDWCTCHSLTIRSLVSSVLETTWEDGGLTSLSDIIFSEPNGICDKVTVQRWRLAFPPLSGSIVFSYQNSNNLREDLN